jgi:hypothetical protein
VHHRYSGHRSTGADGTLRSRGETGIFFNEQTAEAIVKAVDEFERCRENARRRDVEVAFLLPARDVQFSPEATVETYYAVAQPHYVAAVAVTPERRIKRAELRVALMLRLGMLCTWIRAYNDGGVCEAAIWDCPGGIARR